MKPSEVAKMLHVAGQLDPALMPRTDDDHRVKAQTWCLALDVRLTLDVANTIVADLAAGNVPINPGTINQRFLAALPGLPGQQARPRLPQPVEEQRPARPELPATAGRPVPPTRQYEESRNELGMAPAMTDRVYQVACPWCGARIGQRCTVNGRPMTRAACHPARADLAGQPHRPVDTPRRAVGATQHPPPTDPSRERFEPATDDPPPF